jgi:outer membrane immunogenic protein
MFRKILVAATAALASCGVAQAADMARPVYQAPAPVVMAYNWSGFYVGGNIGYGWGDLNATAWGTEASASLDGWFFGGQMGWNWQAAGTPWVWGFEVDSQWSNIGKDVTLTGPAIGNAVATAFTDLDYFGTARLRLGYAWDRAMTYVTGGIAWGSNSIGVNAAVNNLTGSVDSSNSHVGWTIGAGIEWALADNWSAKVEYLYIDLGNENYFPNTFNGQGFDANLDIHTVKVGLNYRFGYSKYPVATAPVVSKY